MSSEFSISSINSNFTVGTKYRFDCNRNSKSKRKTSFKNKVGCKRKLEYYTNQNIDKYHLLVNYFSTIECLANKYIILKIVNSINVREKFNNIEHYIVNYRYHSIEKKNELLYLVYKYQKIVSNINIIKRRFKNKHVKKYDNEYSLDFTLLSSISSKKKMRVTQNNIAYEFTYNDLFRLCNESICYSEFMLTIPKFPKNPYTNVVFKKKNLYNIYVSAKLNNIHVPHLFKSFIFLNFNRELFFEYNDIILNWIATMKYVNSLEERTLIDFVHTIFTRYATHTLNISKFDKYMIKVVEACKFAIYCDVYLTNFNPPDSIYFEKKLKIYNCVKKFIESNPELVKKKQLLKRRSTINISSTTFITDAHVNSHSNEDTESYTDEDSEDI